MFSNTLRKHALTFLTCHGPRRTAAVVPFHQGCAYEACDTPNLSEQNMIIDFPPLLIYSVGLAQFNYMVSCN